MDLQTIWSEIYIRLINFDAFQKEELKSILFCVLGKCTIKENEPNQEIIEYNNDMKGYNMFFVAKRTEGLSDKTLKYYKYVIDALLKKIPKSISQFITDDIRYYLALREIEDKISPVTADNERRIINCFFQWLSIEGYIHKNVCASIKQVKKPKKKKKAFSDVDIAKIKDACFQLGDDIERKRAIALVEFLLSTGCRANEVCLLKKDDIDLETRSAVVYGKGSKERTVYLNQVAKMRLLEYFEVRKDDTEYAFVSIHSPYGKMNVSGIENLIRKISSISKVNDCHPHRFRRTTATMAIKKGMALTDVQRMLGHESLDTTKIYLDLDDSNLRYQHEKYM